MHPPKNAFASVRLSVAIAVADKLKRCSETPSDKITCAQAMQTPLFRLPQAVLDTVVRNVSQKARGKRQQITGAPFEASPAATNKIRSDRASRFCHLVGLLTHIFPSGPSDDDDVL